MRHAFLMPVVFQPCFVWLDGGEEFVLVLPGAGKLQAMQRAEQLCEGIRSHRIRHEGQSLGPVTLSLGVAVYPDDGLTPDAPISAADDALYRAKKGGRNCAVAAGFAPQNTAAD